MFKETNYFVRNAVGLLLIIVPLLSYSQHPNIIYIMTDDLGYGDLSGYGRKDYVTPNLDKLAGQGIKFVNAYAAAPVCTPTRTAFMTGRYPARIPVGLKEPLVKSREDSAVGLTAETPSIAALMKSAGYETALIGKWHLGFQPQHSPNSNGFDYFFGFLAGAADYISHKSGHTGQRAHDLYENDKPVHTEGYLTDLFTQKAVAFLEKSHSKPFFLAVHFNASHWPWQGPADKAYEDSVDFTSNGSPAKYAAMMKSLDNGIGILMKSLEDAKLADKTIVIFTNDNGGERFSDNGGLSQSKMSLWEGGIRVPAFVRWPGKIKAGTITEQVSITMDWTATILAAGGAKASESFPLDGIDLMPICIGKGEVKDRTFYWRTSQRRKQKAIRDGNWKYIQDEKGEYLFDVSKDQVEKNDLKEKYKDVFVRLKIKYGEWEKTVLPPGESLQIQSRPTNLALGNKFIDAFYSFNQDSLGSLLSAAKKSRSGILFYQKWAACANYKVLERSHFFVRNDSTVVFPVMVKDDLMGALAIDFNVTDTFHVVFRNDQIVSVTTSSNDLPEYYKAREWVNKNRPDLVKKQCNSSTDKDLTPCDCVLGMIKGFGEYTNNKKRTK